MNTSASFSGNTLRIKSSRLVFWVVTLVGMSMLGMGFYLLGRTIFPQDHVLIGFGLIFSSGGLFFYMNSEYHKIHINEEPGYISLLESSNRVIVPLKIPIRYFSCINILQNVSKGNTKHTAVSYDILLMSRFGTSLFLAQYQDQKKAMEFGQKLKDLMGIKLEFDLVFPDENAKYESISELSLPPRASLKKSSVGNQVNLAWKGKYNLFHFFLIWVIDYGFFHIFHFAVIPEKGGGIWSALLYGFTAVFSILLLITMIYNLLGEYYLEISPNGLRYYTKIFGNKASEKVITRAQISLIKNTINMGTEGIAIFSKDGVNIAHRIMNALKSGDNNPSRFFSLAEDVYSLKDEILTLNTASLTITEKLIIEDEILKKVR